MGNIFSEERSYYGWKEDELYRPKERIQNGVIPEKFSVSGYFDNQVGTDGPRAAFKAISELFKFQLKLENITNFGEFKFEESPVKDEALSIGKALKLLKKKYTGLTIGKDSSKKINKIKCQAVLPGNVKYHIRNASPVLLAFPIDYSVIQSSQDSPANDDISNPEKNQGYSIGLVTGFEKDTYEVLSFIPEYPEKFVYFTDKFLNECCRDLWIIEIEYVDKNYSFINEEEEA